MANWHYFNENKEKIGPITGSNLKQLVQQGTITPETFVEDPNGRTGLAKDVKGLTFPELTLEEEMPSATNQSTVAPFPIAQPVQVPPVAPPPVNVFCANCGNSISTQAVACMSCGARPTGHKKFCRQCGIALNPEQVVCIKCGAGLTGNSGVSNFAANITSAFQTVGGSLGAPSNAMSKKLNIYFMVYWICMAVAISLQLIGTIITHMGVSIAQDGRNADSLLTLGMGLTMIVTPIYIVGAVFGYMLLYQLWKRIPLDIARTTPGKAVIFMLIPIVNLYWVFVAYKGLGEDMNKTLQRHGNQHQVNESLGLPLCILAIIANIPFGLYPFIGSYIAVLVGLASFIVGVFFLKSIKDGAIALLEQGEQ
jgi:hypothetical protein